LRPWARLAGRDPLETPKALKVTGMGRGPLPSLLEFLESVVALAENGFGAFSA